jgi:hypothetical protein
VCLDDHVSSPENKKFKIWFLQSKSIDDIEKKKLNKFFSFHELQENVCFMLNTTSFQL